MLCVHIEQQKLKELFVQSTGSFSKLLPEKAFTKILLGLGVLMEQCSSCYRAFNVANNPEGINYFEFLQGLAAMDPTTKHGGKAGAIRCQYIFRFYDADKDGKLSRKEVR